MATAAQISDYCNTTKKCGKALLSVLRETPSELDSERVSASVTAIVEQDTDLTLSGDYYHYEEDPTQVGFFSVATAGRTLVTGGNGVPIAPLRYLLRPEVVHRFGDFSAKLWVTTGRYVTGAGDSTSGIGLKLQYKFTRKFRMWATVGGQRDTDEAGNETRSGSFAMGGGYRF